MIKITTNAFAKLNLTLDVTGKMPGGYHGIETIFQSVSLCDRLTVETCGEGIKLQCSEKGLPTDDENICVRAAKAYLETVRSRAGVCILLEKNIPLAAGLAGGSADAAAVLTSLNMLFGEKLSPAAMMSLAAKLGADVPFCMTGGTQLATGVGNRLRKLPDCPDCDIVLIYEGNKPSTAALYGRLDKQKITAHPDTAAALVALERGSIRGIAAQLYNVFRPVWGYHPEILIEKLKNLGALGAELTGSGPTVFGIFSKGFGRPAAERLLHEYKNVFLCSPSKCGGIYKKEEL